MTPDNRPTLKANLAIHFLVWVAAPMPAYLALVFTLLMET